MRTPSRPNVNFGKCRTIFVFNDLLSLCELRRSGRHEAKKIPKKSYTLLGSCITE